LSELRKEEVLLQNTACCIHH